MTRQAALATERELAVELFQAAVAGAASGPVTERAVDAIELPSDRHIWMFAIGKAAPEMAHAALAALHRGLHQVAGGLVVSPNPPTNGFGAVACMRGDHPTPGRQSFQAAARIGELVAGRRSGDAALVLVSGGASSLIASPPPGMSEGELAHLFDLLLASGLDISAVNAVRKRFSRWAGGRLALALAPAATTCLIVSDVIGDDPSDIGSGPCVPDPYTVKDVIALLEGAKLMGRLSPKFRDHLQAIARGVVPETPKRTHPAFAHVTARVIANTRLALDAAAVRAREAGIEWVEVAAAPIAGEAAMRGEELAKQLIALRAQSGGSGRLCRLWGGETTVHLPSTIDASFSGLVTTTAGPRGGRSQELALAAARTLAGAGDAAAGITILAAGTDGRDGPTDAAGACVDCRTWAAIEAAGRNPQADLDAHDSYGALDSVGALIRTGPTGTNVADVVVGLVS